MSDIDEITERMKRFPQIIQKMLSLQVKAAGILTVLVAVIFGKHAGVSALIGSVSVIFGVLLASKIAHKTALSKEPAAIIINVLKAEAVKIIIVGRRVIGGREFQFGISPLFFRSYADYRAS